MSELWISIALLLSQLAAELPEMMNPVIWVRQGKYRLALANTPPP